MATYLVSEGIFPVVIKIDTTLLPDNSYLNWILQQVLNKVFYYRWLKESTPRSQLRFITVMIVGPEKKTSRFLKIYETIIKMARQEEQWESLAEEIAAGRLTFQLVKSADIADIAGICRTITFSGDEYQEDYKKLLASTADTRAIFKRLHDTRPTDTDLDSIDEWKVEYSRELYRVMHPDIFMEYMTRTPSGWDVCLEIQVDKV